MTRIGVASVKSMGKKRASMDDHHQFQKQSREQVRIRTPKASVEIQVLTGARCVARAWQDQEVDCIAGRAFGVRESAQIAMLKSVNRETGWR